MSAIDQEVKDKIREFMSRKGEAMLPEEEQNPYNRHDWRAMEHHRGKKLHPKTYQTIYREPCNWVVPPGSVLVERWQSNFQDTFTENSNDCGLEIDGVSCECGEYQNITIRWEGNAGDLLQEILGPEPPVIGIEL